ncbi:1581_t:CDS:1 [Cetraspora pellucida]|uniref:1581_t:CDS:1 n=1 Tax=Cetraspora pellucida TaxID=1433469 RepID=A0A9N9IQ88_9GLOM|nr:1581_t:CDS:1 [Cetraspora pellucida]
MSGNRRARRSQTGAQYFDDFDRIRNINSSNRSLRRIGRNNTPAPSTGEVEHALNQISLRNRRSRRSSIDSRRRSASQSLPRDAININTNNPGVESPEKNIGHSGSIETSSLQPPYEADEAQNNNNSSETNQSHDNFRHELAVI